MYKVLLVDDEIIIREAIRENVKWQELGFELVGACKDGMEAMQAIQCEKPDLIVTDICMPYIDGIELSKYVFEHYTDTKVVIISGYDEFEYAKKAVKYQVLEYILKPVTSYELSEILTKIRGDFDKRRQDTKQMLELRKKSISNLPVLKAHLLSSLIHGKMSGDKLQQFLLQYQIDLQGTYFKTVIMQLKDIHVFTTHTPEVSDDLIVFAALNIAEEVVSRRHAGAVFQNEEQKLVLLLKADFVEQSEEAERRFRQMATEVCREIIEAIRRFFAIETLVLMGKTVHHVSKLAHSYEEAKKAAERLFVRQDAQWMDADELLKKEPEIDLFKLREAFIRAIRRNEKQTIEILVESFMEQCYSSFVTRNQLIFYMQNLATPVWQFRKDNETGQDGDKEQEHALTDALLRGQSAKDLKEHFIRFLLETTEELFAGKDSFGKKQAMLALDYIEKQYGNEDVSLQSVCAYLSISTSYFSTLFKNHTGKTFVEVLTIKRMERAKHLIANTALKLYEIAEQVGYGDAHYFSLTFKKYTGLTPTQYAKKTRMMERV